MVITFCRSLLDVGLLEAYRSELMNHKSSHRHHLLAFTDLIVMNSDVVELIRLVISTDEDFRHQLLNNPSTIKQVIRLLGISYKGER